MGIRSAITGRFVRASTAKRWPKMTTQESDNKEVVALQKAINGAYSALVSSKNQREGITRALHELGPFVTKNKGESS